MEEEVLVLVVVVGFNPVGITPAGWPADTHFIHRTLWHSFSTFMAF